MLSFLRLLRSCILTVFLFYATSSYFIVALKLFNQQRSAGFPEQSFQTLVFLKAVFFPLCIFISFLVNFSDDNVLLSLNGPQSDHGCALKSSTKRCDDSCVQIVDQKLNSFSVSKIILTSIISLLEVLTFSFICWFNGLSVNDKDSFSGIVKVCCKIVGLQLLKRLYSKRNVVQKVTHINSLSDPILSSGCTVVTSGRRYCAPLTKTNQFSHSLLLNVRSSFMPLPLTG